MDHAEKKNASVSKFVKITKDDVILSTASEKRTKRLGMDDTAKRGAQPTSELFTVILCGPNFAVSPRFEPKIVI